MTIAPRSPKTNYFIVCTGREETKNKNEKKNTPRGIYLRQHRSGEREKNIYVDKLTDSSGFLVLCLVLFRFFFLVPGDHGPQGKRSFLVYLLTLQIKTSKSSIKRKRPCASSTSLPRALKKEVLPNPSNKKKKTDFHQKTPDQKS